MKKLLSVLVCLFFLGVCTISQAEGPSMLEFEVLQESYAKQLASIAETIKKTKIQPLIKNYDAALGRLEDSLAKNDNLEGLVAIRDERKRANRELGISEKQFVEGEPELVKLQRQLLGALEKIGTGREKQEIETSRNYLGRLDALRSKYTKNKQVEAALVVDAEAKRLKAAMSGGKPLSAEPVESEGEIEGRWLLVSPGGGGIRIKVEITKAKEERYLMKGSGIIPGKYVWEKQKLTKLRGPRGDGIDIVWERSKDGFTNSGSDYTGWKLVPADAGAHPKGKK